MKQMALFRYHNVIIMPLRMNGNRVRPRKNHGADGNKVPVAKANNVACNTVACTAINEHRLGFAVKPKG